MKKLDRQPKTEKLIRETRVVPGWHCYRGGPPCCTVCDGRGQHGIHNESWIYTIKGAARREALVLTVSSGYYPESTGMAREVAEGVDLTLHVAYPTDTDQLLEPPHECSLLTDEHCYIAYSTALGAGEFWRAEGLALPKAIDDVSETFWRAFERRFVELRNKARAARVDRDYEACPRCLGRGFSKKLRGGPRAACKKAGRR